MSVQAPPRGEVELQSSKPPPASPAIEMAVLGAIMLEPVDAWPIARDALATEDFYLDGHALVFDAMRDLHDRGVPPDPQAVLGELRGRDLLDKCGGPGVIMKMIECIPSAANLRAHCQIVAEKSALRRAIRGMVATLEAAYKQEQPVEQILDGIADIPRLVRERVNIGTDDLYRPYVRDIADAVSEMAEEQRRVLDGEVPPTRYIPTGIAMLSEQLGGGLLPGDSVHALARPGTGKTTIATYMAAHMALAGTKTLYVQLDMTRERYLPYVARTLGAISGYTTRASDLRTPEASDIGRARLQEVVTASGRWKGKLYVVTDKHGGMDRKLRAVLQYCRIGRELGCEVAIVDQVECVGGWGGKDRSNYADIVNGLHFGIARELGMTYIGLGQINREGARRPGPTDAQETDAWHKRPDVMLLLHDEQTAMCFDKQSPGFVRELNPKTNTHKLRQPKYDDPESIINMRPDIQRKVELCIAKSRASASGEWLAFEMDFARGRVL